MLGPGGVGGFLAAALSRAGEDVVVVAREPTAAVIAERGIAVQSVRLGDFVARPAASAVLAEPAEVLFIATKATALAAALDRVVVAPGLAVPLLNGLEHLAHLRGRFGADRVPAATIRIESDRPEPGRIVQTSPFLRIELAADEPGLRGRLEPVLESLARAEVPALVGESEAQVMWSKLVRLCALACTTSASGWPIGRIRADPEWRAALEGCIEETSAVADAEGAHIDPAATRQELGDAHPELGSSMQRDLAAGREPELDAIAGAVLRAGARHGLACPTVARLADQIAQRAGLPAIAGA